jgi:hypothetical protein
LRVFNAIAAAVIVTALFLVWIGRVSPPSASSITEGPVVLHIKGGLLEVSTIHATEVFERSTREKILGLPVGKTITRIRVPAVYRYHVELDSDFRVLLKDRTFTVISPSVVPSLPVAIDTSRLQAEASGRWSFLTREVRIEALQESITATLAMKASSPAYVELQREVARQTLREFVARWLITQEQWKGASGYPIRVYFADEPMSQSFAGLL